MSNSSSVIADVIRHLDYNFENFELSHFLRHLEQVRNRALFVVPWSFRPDLFGLWIPQESADYIFYNQGLHPIHRIHTVLHEVAHVILGHSRRDIRSVLPLELLEELGVTQPHGYLRTAAVVFSDDPEEREAEMFVYLIQQYIVKGNRLAELVGQSSSITGLKPYTDSMGFSG